MCPHLSPSPPPKKKKIQHKKAPVLPASHRSVHHPLQNQNWVHSPPRFPSLPPRSSGSTPRGDVVGVDERKLPAPDLLASEAEEALWKSKGLHIYIDLILYVYNIYVHIIAITCRYVYNIFIFFSLLFWLCSFVNGRLGLEHEWKLLSISKSSTAATQGLAGLQLMAFLRCLRLAA